MIDSFSYQLCFVITASIYFVSILPLVLIFRLVKKEQILQQKHQVEMVPLIQNQNQEEGDENPEKKLSSSEHSSQVLLDALNQPPPPSANSVTKN